MQSAIVAFTAIGTAVVLLLSGALDETRRVDVEAESPTTVVEGSTIRPKDQVMINYLSTFDEWNECVTSQPADATSDVVSAACGTLPKQPDDPQLNSYLSKVLDWNKCASPRLRRGGLEQAVIACGPQPESPVGN